METDIQIFEGIAEHLDDASVMFDKYGLVPMKTQAERLKEDVENILDELKEKQKVKDDLEFIEIERERHERIERDCKKEKQKADDIKSFMPQHLTDAERGRKKESEG